MKVKAVAVVACNLALGLAAFTVASGALAKDALKATVTSSGFTFQENGNPLSAGTYAIGTLKIQMVVVGNKWPADLGSVALGLAVEPRGTNPATVYPVPIRLRQVGKGLVLTVDPDTHSVTGTGWTGASTIAISVPQEIIDDPAMNADGAQLVGNLQTETTATRSGFDTVTTVKIMATLMHPAVAKCLKTATFVANTPMNRNLSASTDGLDFTYGYNRNNGNFSWAVTPNNQQIRDNVIVVNTCPTEQYYDVEIGLPQGFQKTSPGNVVESYVSMNASAGDFALIDPYSELKAATTAGDMPASGVEAGSSLCIQGNTLPAGYSQWLRSKVELVTSGFTSDSAIPAPPAPVAPYYTMFTSDLSEVNTACVGTHSLSAGQGTAGGYVKSKTCTAQGSTVCTNPNGN